jgi:hypothetical protein
MEVLTNKPMHKFDTMNNTAIILKKSISKLLENMLVVLVSCNVICTNKEV